MVDSSDGGDDQISIDSGTRDMDELTEDVDCHSSDDENAGDSSEMELEESEEDEDSDEEQDEECDEEAISDDEIDAGSVDAGTSSRDSKLKKRKQPDLDQSLRALKRLATTFVEKPSESTDGILSNEDFRRIKELKVTLLV